MRLNVFERITLLGLLPSEGNFVTLKVVRDSQNVLALTEKELKDFDVTEVRDGDKTRYTWNEAGNEGVGIELGEKACDLIKDALEKLDKEKKLTKNHFNLYEKFCN